MNRTLIAAFGAMMGISLYAPLMAQDQFPDVPEYHWVYSALMNMKREGILVGYPDGLFRPGRPVSRAELAAAINAAYQKLRGSVGGVQSQITALQEQIRSLQGQQYVRPQDLQPLRDALSQLQSDVNRMRGWGDDIANLRRMADMFQRDLAELGVDVEAMKRDLADIAKRLDELEKRKPPVAISGDANFVVHAGYSDDGLFGITVDGRPTGFGRGSYFGEPVGVTRDLTIGHEAAFRFDSTNESGPQWHATVVVGNLLTFVNFPSGGLPATIYGNQSGVMWDLPFFEQPENVYFQDFGVKYDTSLIGQGFTLELGRLGYQNGAYFFKRIDNTPYFKNERWDNHNWYFDGGRVHFDWGTVGLNVWAGRNSQREDVWGNEIWPMSAGSGQDYRANGGVPIDQSLGFDLGVKLGNQGDLLLTYIFLDSNSVVSALPGATGDVNRVAVWGGALNFNITQNLKFNGGYSRSDLYENSSTRLDDDNFAWWAQLNWEGSNVKVHAGYREIQPYFGAPGDWGRLGFLWNPVDIRGAYAGVSWQGGNIGISAKGYWYEGAENINISKDDQIVGVMAYLHWQPRQNWNVFLGWERAEYDLVNSGGIIGGPFSGAGDNNEINWYRIGFWHDMGNNQTLRFLYEISDYDDNGLLGALGSFAPGNRKGGLFTTQWSVKF